MKKEGDMTLVKEIRNRVLEFKEGKVVTLADFGVPVERQPSLNVTLNRLVAEGVLKRLSKGRFFKERQSVFGVLPPSEMEVVKDFLVKNGQTVGYITGTQSFAEMGLTTQVSSKLLVGTNKYRRTVKRGDYEVSFLLQPNPIRENEIEKYRLLDALRLVREIPATTPDDAVRFLIGLLERMKDKDRLRLTELAQGYTPYVRALLGAMLEQVGFSAYGLKQGLNGVTSYKLPVTESVLANKKKWNIV